MLMYLIGFYPLFYLDNSVTLHGRHVAIAENMRSIKAQNICLCDIVIPNYGMIEILDTIKYEAQLINRWILPH